MPLKTRTPLRAIGAKKPKCKVCTREFTKTRPIQPVCEDIKCSLEYVKRKRVAKAVAPYRTKPKKSPSSRSHQLELTQKAFNAWIRWRDRDKPCISSGATTAVQWDAGHYIARGSAKGGSLLRFDEANVHKQTSDDNNFRGGGLIPSYRVELIKRIGIDEVERMENTQGTKKWSIDELKEIRATYAKRLRDEQRACPGFD